MESLEEPACPATAPSSPGGNGQPNDALRQVLIEVRIIGKAQKQILDLNVNPLIVRAWLLWASAPVSIQGIQRLAGAQVPHYQRGVISDRDGAPAIRRQRDGAYPTFVSS